MTHLKEHVALRHKYGGFFIVDETLFPKVSDYRNLPQPFWIITVLLAKISSDLSVSRELGTVSVPFVLQQCVPWQVLDLNGGDNSERLAKLKSNVSLPNERLGHVLNGSREQAAPRSIGLLVVDGNHQATRNQLSTPESFRYGRRDTKVRPRSWTRPCPSWSRIPGNMPGSLDITGRVVDTIDCHAPTGIGFFSMWVFYNESWLLYIEDCFYYCVMEDALSTNENPLIRTTGVLNYANGTGICHREGISSVSGLAVGDTNPLHPAQFDLLLGFIGRATLSASYL